MCNDFFKFFDDITRNFPMHLSVHYCKICDWEITVWKKGCASDFPTAIHDGEDVIIVRVQDTDLQRAFAQAYVELTDWLSEFRGGY